MSRLFFFGLFNVVVTTVDLLADDRKVALRRIQRVGLPRKTDGTKCAIEVYIRFARDPPVIARKSSDKPTLGTNPTNFLEARHERLVAMQSAAYAGFSKKSRT